MTQKLMISTLTVASLLMACTPNPRKAPIHKSGGAAAEEPIESAKVRDIVGKTQGCFQLGNLIEELNSQTGRTFSVHVRDLDLLQKPEGAKNLQSWMDLGKDKQENLATRSQLLIHREKPVLFEQLNAEELLNSQLLKSYIQVLSQVECKTITFADGKTFRIEYKTPATPQPSANDQVQDAQQLQQRRNNKNNTVVRTPIKRKPLESGLTMVGTNHNERRTYTVVGNRLHITIYQPVGTLETCNSGTINSLEHKAEYVLSFSTNKQKTYRLTNRLADLLKLTLNYPGSLESKGVPVIPTTKNRGGNIGGGAGGYQVTSDDLNHFSRQITAGQLKKIECK